VQITTGTVEIGESTKNAALLEAQDEAGFCKSATLKDIKKNACC